MKRALLILGALTAAAWAQEASSGFELQVTASACADLSNQLTEYPRDGAPVAAGFHLIAYPTWKIDRHWSVTAAVQAYSRPYFYSDLSTQGYGLNASLLQASVNYSTFWKNNSLVLRAGELPTAFGSFLLRYDDFVNPLVDMPLGYGYAWAYDGVTLDPVGAAEADLTLGHADFRAQLTNTSPANPHSIFSHTQNGGWAGGAGYTIRQGFRVGVSAFRGPYLDDDDTQGLENARLLPATALGLDVEWGHGPWNVNAELQRFQFPNDIAPGTVPRYGYAEVRRTLGPRWYIAARASGRRQDSWTNEQVWETALGFRPGAHQLIKFDYERVQLAWGEPVNVLAVQFVTTSRPISIARD